jgi:hypothetical protein
VRWLVDECVAASMVGFLRTAGHDVVYVAESGKGLSDTVTVNQLSLLGRD